MSADPEREATGAGGELPPLPESAYGPDARPLDPLPARECASCGAAIVWARHYRSHKPMPFDAAPAPGGRWSIRDRVGVLVAIHLAADEAEPGGLGWVPHWTTCPHAAMHRRPR